MPPLALVSGHVSVKTSVAATGGFRPKADVPDSEISPIEGIAWH
jgi:hypothetical protein